MASPVLHPLRRALLYVPTSSPRFLEHSLTVAVDNVTYDLEDSVAESVKPAARTALQGHLSSLVRQNAAMREIAVRINSVATPHAVEDIRAVAALPNVDAIVVPKVNSAADLALVEDVIRQAAPHRAEPIKLLALIESARAVMDLRSICGATPNLKGLVFAADNFALDMGLRRTADMHELTYARSAVTTAARAFGLESAIDAVCTTLKRPDWLKRDCFNGRTLGFNGKQCIHPGQTGIVQTAFSPQKSEVEWAIRVEAAAEKAEAAGNGVWALQQRMVDAPGFAKARAVLAKAEQCGVNIDAIRNWIRGRQPPRAVADAGSDASTEPSGGQSERNGDY